MKVRRIFPHEGLRLRALRLRALADAPAAFAVSQTEARARPKEYWENFAWEAALAETSATFVAEENARWYGVVGSFVARNQLGTADLVGMWVDPRRRRSGIGSALVEAVVQWARGCGVKRLQLWVTDTNHQAKSLYSRQGFIETGHTESAPSNPNLRGVLMVRELI